jgi:uncharacterized membrane-anchored protein YhcB (DUF1043 family)
MTELIPSILSFVALVVSAVVGVFVRSSNKKSDQHDTLWDSHNKKESETIQLKELREKFETHKENYVRFETITTANYQHILETIKQNSQDIVHVEKNMQQGFNNMSKALERINHKLDIE